MPQGVIKKLVSDKGFGFIAGEGQSDLFFHCSEVEDGLFETLTVGQSVQYEAGEGPKGPRAQNVRSVEATSEA
jgi:CspA family cold shock protein